MRYVHYLKNIFEKQKLLFISIFWGSLAGVFSQGLNFITNIFLVRFLGIDYGELVLYTSTNAMLQTFSIIGLNVLATVFVAKYLKENKLILSKIIPNMYFFVTGMTIIVALIAFFINEINFYSINLWFIKSTLIKLVIIIWFIFSTLDLLQISILLGFSAFKDVAKVSLIKGCLSILLVLVFTKFYGLNGVIFAYAISFITSFGFNLIFIKKNCINNKLKLNYKIDLKLISKLLKMSIPIFIASFVLIPAQWGINYIIFKRESGALALTIFGVANQWMVLVQFFPLQISKVILPFLTNNDKNAREYRNTEKTGLLISIIIGIALIIAILLFEKTIISIYKIDYDIVKIPFRILMIAALFSITNLFLGQTLIAAGKTWLKAFIDFMMAMSLFGAFIASSSLSSPISLAFAYCVSFIVATFITIMIKRKSSVINSNKNHLLHNF